MRTVDEVCYDMQVLSKDIKVSRETCVLNDDVKVVFRGNGVGHIILLSADAQFYRFTGLVCHLVYVLITSRVFV